jgi:hypothetical protein
MFRRWVLRNGALALAGGLALLAAGQPASAHHSFAMYDRTKTLKLAGTVVSYDWSNPHVYIELAVPVDGVNRNYSLEMTAIPMLTRIGWSRNTVHPGDKLTAVFAPMKNGTPAGILMEITLPDGKVLNTGLPGQNAYAKPQ